MKERNIYQCVHGIILKSFILALLGTFIMPFLKAQTAFDNIIPPSPTAASLMKFTDIPVSLFTGVPNIEIPLYVVSSKRLSVPITVRYHGAGTKVQEAPGWLGHGWALDAGGSISRTVMGKADELENGYIDFSQNFPDVSSLIGFGSWADYENPLLPDMAPDPNTAYSMMSYDAEPDIFNFSFPGHSGKFVFATDVSGNTTIQVIPQQNIKIIPTKNAGSKYFNSFEIIAEDGTRYIFGTDGERYAYDAVDRAGETAITTGWHLVKIISYDDSDAISFTYAPGVGADVSQRLDAQDIIQGCSNFSNYTCQSTCPTSGLSHTDVSSNYVTRYISKIESANCTVVFEKLSSPVKLTSMKIYQGDNLIKTFDLTYTSGSRFLLSTIVEICNGVSKPPYKLDYDDISLPVFTSNGVDYWGFYNGKNGNSCKIPSQWVGYEYINLGDLEPSSTYVKAGSLKRITYPTGGYSEFIFEANDYKLDKVETKVTSTSKIVTASCAPGATACCMGEGDLQTDAIDLDRQQTVTITTTFSVTMEGSHYVMIDGQSFNVSGTTYLLLNAGTHTLKAHADCGGDVSITVKYLKPTNTYIKNKTGGGLRIKKVVHYDGISHDNDIIKEYEYTQFSDPSFSSGVLVGNVPEYSDDYYSCTTVEINGYWYDFFCHYIRLSSNPVFAMGSINGSPVVYSNVTVYDGGKVSGTANSKNGKTESVFSLFPPSVFSTFPYATSISYDWKNGLLLEKTAYNSSGVKVSYEKNIYDKTESLSNTSRAKVFGVKARYLYRGILDPTDYSLLRQCYYVPVGSALLSQRTSTIYDLYGNNPVTTIEDYTYSDFLLSSKTITNSDGSILKTQYIYPHDFSNVSTGFIGEMKTEHILSKPVEEYTIRNNTQIINGVHTTYKTGTDVGLPNVVYQLEANPSLIDGTTFHQSNYNGNYQLGSYYYPVATYDSYDNGNITQYHKEGDIDRSFIWGYDNTLPVAKIENIAYTDIPAVILTAITNHTFNGGTTKAEIETDRTFLQATLQALINNTNYKVTYYTYAPLFGLTSETSPNSLTTYYEYDSFGRLQYIRDYDGNIIKKYDYHYIGQ